MQRDLVERAGKGDHDAFAALVAGRIGRLDGAARLILRDPDQAKDAVQEALLSAWRALPTLRDPDLFDAWIHRLLVRACVDESRRLRRHRVDVPLAELQVPAADEAAALADRDELARGFRRLSTEQRSLIVLHHYLALPLPEVADAMGIPLGTAKSRLHRALSALRASLEADARTMREPVGGRPA